MIMRNLLALAALLLLTFLGLGWYLGWYKVQTAPGANGHREIQIDLDTDKIKGDVIKEENKIHDILTPKGSTNPQSSNNNPATKGTTASFRTEEDGSTVFPGANPTPPSSGPTLPPPR
jgi:hypothetical protein